MASLLDRIRCANDWDTDGGYVNPAEFNAYLQLWAAGNVSTATFKSHFSMTTAQGNQLDDILATRPAAPLLLINVAPYVLWSDKVAGIINLASQYVPEFDTDGEVQTALGI
jgi:hypothetical protein